MQEFNVGDKVIYVHGHTRVPWPEVAEITRKGSTYEVKSMAEGRRHIVLEHRLSVNSWMARDRLVAYSEEKLEELKNLAAGVKQADGLYQNNLEHFYKAVRNE